MLARIIEHNSDNNKRLLFPKLLDIWLGQKVENQLRPPDLVVPNYSRDVAQHILVNLMNDGWLKEDVHFTPYTSLCYVDLGRKYYWKRNPENQAVFYKLPIGATQDSRNIIYRAAPTTSDFPIDDSPSSSNGSSSGYSSNVKAEKTSAKSAKKEKENKTVKQETVLKSTVVKSEKRTTVKSEKKQGGSPPKKIKADVEVICLDSD